MTIAFKEGLIDHHDFLIIIDIAIKKGLIDHHNFIVIMN